MRLSYLLIFGALSILGCMSSDDYESDASEEDEGPSGCCKYCGAESQACGDSCISNDKECHTDDGCACEGSGST